MGTVKKEIEVRDNNGDIVEDRYPMSLFVQSYGMLDYEIATLDALLVEQTCVLKGDTTDFYITRIA